jgi:hypothetical protein
LTTFPKESDEGQWINRLEPGLKADGGVKEQEQQELDKVRARARATARAKAIQVSTDQMTESREEEYRSRRK